MKLHPCPKAAQTKRKEKKKKRKKERKKILTLLSQHSHKQSAPEGASVERQEKKLSMI